MRWLVLVAACGGGGDPAVDAAIEPDAAIDAAPLGTRCGRCQVPGTVQNLGAAPNALAEASGMVASRTQPGIIYTHNDSGDTARIFAIDDRGALVATLTLGGATHTDWEDIAIGPCPTGSCIYVGDIGDNSMNRATKTVYRFPEPTLALGMPAVTQTIANVEAFPFSYPIGLDFFHNAETLLVHPTSGDIYVVTKENAGTPSTVFKFPQPLTSATATLQKLTVLPFPTGADPDISGGDIDPCGGSVLLRLGSAKLYILDAPATFDAVFTPTPPLRTLPIANEANGEAISWNSDGNGYFTISEGAGAQLHAVACQ